MANAINWFEIPSVDFERAVTFYNTILGIELRKELFNSVPNAIFPGSETEVAGAVIQDDNVRPSTSGAVIYLNAGNADNLDNVISRIGTAGGKVLLPKTDIGDPGFIALLLDTEGNRVGLHSPRG